MSEALTQPLTEPLTASRMAKALGVSEPKVKTALKDLAIEPSARKGCCRLYTAHDLDRIREALQG